VAVKGDLNGMRKLADKIRQLTTAGFKAELSQVLAAAAMKQVADEFRGSRDPYGKPWEKLAIRQGKPLLDTGRMRNAVTAEPTANGFRLRIATRYAVTHQYGATIEAKTPRGLRFKAGGRFYALKRVRIPRRQMLPEADTGRLGPIWTAAFNREAEAIIRRRLGKAA
jgi:phage gpG-like protein